MNGFELFIRDKENEEVSPRTIQYYSERFEIFFKFLHRKENTPIYSDKGEILDIPCSELNKYIILEFVDYIKAKNENIKATSINNYLVAIRTFVNFLYKEDYIPKIEVKLKRVTEEIKKHYSIDEICKLIEIPEKEKKKSFTSYRNWVLINYLFATRQPTRNSY